ncbi:MAG TPA: hypothetical protein VHT97_11870 [Acidimicrobiales bacterium]|nr:hypothetical protein [Acidimicrobiales bacterium]
MTGEGTDSAALLRRCFAGLAAVGVAATAVELALIRHWTSTEQLIPWAALGALVLGLALLVARPSRGRLRAIRALTLAVVLTAAFGIFEHVHANYEAAPLDFRYTNRWATMSTSSKWWAAASQSVGPSPTLAPGVLAQSALCLLFATLGHPALATPTVELDPAGEGEPARR